MLFGSRVISNNMSKKKNSRQYTKQMLSGYAKGARVTKEQFEDLDGDFNDLDYATNNSR